MTTTIAGTVQRIDSNAVSTRYGTKTSWNIILTNGTKIGAGFNKPNVEAGDAISCDVEGTYNNMVKGTLKTNKAPLAAAPIGTSAASSSFIKKKDEYQPRAFPVPLLHPDRAIIRQNALAHATNIVVAMLDHEASPPTDALAAQRVIDVARMFEAYSSGFTEMPPEEVAVTPDVEES